MSLQLNVNTLKLFGIIIDFKKDQYAKDLPF